MIAVVRSEMYRFLSIRSWWLSLIAAALVTAGMGYYGDAAWAGLVGMATFLFGVVAAAQHYQHRTAVLVFLARPRRLAVLAGQALTYAAAAGAFAAVTGLPVLLTGHPDEYLVTVFAAPFMAVFAVANATILRRPIWIIAGYGLWFVAVEGVAGRLELPGPFTGYLRGTAQTDLAMLAVFVGWAVVAGGVAGWAIRRDVTSD
jgi:hypothetical protein